MRLIHCTQKLLKELDVPLVELDNIPSASEGLGSWYANLIRIDRKKCLLFTNEKTLYSFLIPKVVKSTLKNIEDEFLINLNFNLQAEGFSLEVINKVMQECKEIGFAKTASKSVLGSMNEFAFEFEFLIRREGGIDHIKILQINQQINRTPMSAIKYQYPIEAFRTLLLGTEPVLY